MTILKKETKDNNRVELTIRVEKPEWQKALDDAYQANRASATGMNPPP